MVADPELIADRRRLRRKLTVWRVLAFGALLVAVVTGGLAVASRTGAAPGASSQIARISVSGFIAGDQRMADLFKRVGEARSVKGVVVSVSSPGGTTAGSEELFRSIRTLAGKKPTVAFVDGMAASGGYIVALASDHIVSRETSIVGSIGVLFQYPNVSGLLSRLGVEVGEVKSAPLKAEPSPFKPASPEARAALQAVVNDTNAWFKGLVQSRRNLSEPELAAVSDGRVFSARQAVSLKLVDELGSEREAVSWLEREKKVDKDLPVRDWKPTGSTSFPLWSALAFGVDLVGFHDAAGAIRSLAPVVIAAGDLAGGLLVVWRPPVSEP